MSLSTPPPPPPPANLEAVLHSVFSVPQEVECRVWHRYMTTYKLLRLTTPTLTLEDAGLYNGQVSDQGVWSVGKIIVIAIAVLTVLISHYCTLYLGPLR